MKEPTPLARAVRANDRDQARVELRRVLARQKRTAGLVISFYVLLAMFAILQGAYFEGITILAVLPTAAWYYVCSASGLKMDLDRSERLAPFVQASFLSPVGAERSTVVEVDLSTWIAEDQDPVATEAALYAACLGPSRVTFLVGPEARNKLGRGDWIRDVGQDEQAALKVPTIGDSGWLFEADPPRRGQTRRVRVGTHRVEFIFDPSYRDARNIAIMIDELEPNRYLVFARLFPELIEIGHPAWSFRRTNPKRTVKFERAHAEPGSHFIYPVADDELAPNAVAKLIQLDNTRVWRTARSTQTQGEILQGVTPREVATELVHRLRSD